MKISKEARKLSKQLFRDSFTGASLDAEKVKKGADLVIRTKPRQYVGVLKEFARLIRLEAAKHHAIIESVAELEAAEKSAITRTIHGKYGADVTTEYKTNPGLIGGLRIQVGSDVVDASIRSRLDRLANDLAE
jgi:F-type H+-transporting ATPase subunit delta